MTEAEIHSAVTRLDAESAVRRLIARYAHAMDEGRFEAVADLLRHAEFDVVGKSSTGRDDILTFLEAGIQRHADGTPRTWHAVDNSLIDVDPSGEKAASVSYYTVHQEVDGFPLQPIVAGKYFDQFERHDGEWRFTRRAVTAHLVGDLQHHVMGENGA
ncbi:nuclear transport factor 2 family protein [Brucellaceae bacterium D45D]